MRFNNSPGTYFLYLNDAKQPDGVYSYSCRFCGKKLLNDDIVLPSRNPMSWITIKTQVGDLIRVRCCPEEECREMAGFLGAWK